MREKISDFLFNLIFAAAIIIISGIIVTSCEEKPPRYEYVDLDGNVGYSDACGSYRYLSCNKGNGTVLVREYHRVGSEE